MRLYGVVINISGMEPSIKLVEEDVYDWINFPINPKATIEIVPISVFDKFEQENKHMDLFREGTNELVKPGDYENAKAEIAPAFKSGFKSVDEAKAFAKKNGHNYMNTIIKYLQS